MFDFLIDNPYLLFLIIYAVYRFFRGGRKEVQAQSGSGQGAGNLKPGRPPQHVEPGAAARGETTIGRSLEERLESLALEWERKASGAPVPSTAPAPEVGLSAHSVGAAAGGSAEADRPFAPELVTESAPAETIGSFDTTRVFEPSAASVEARERAFDFRSSGNVKAAEWHSAGGFAAFAAPTSDRSIPQAGFASHPDDAPTDIAEFVTRPDDLSRAIVLSEVLGRPRTLRPWRATA